MNEAFETITRYYIQVLFDNVWCRYNRTYTDRSKAEEELALARNTYPDCKIRVIRSETNECVIYHSDP